MMVHRVDSGGTEPTALGKVAVGVIILVIGGITMLGISRLNSSVTRADLQWLESEGRQTGDSFTKADGQKLDHRLDVLAGRLRLLELWMAEDRAVGERIHIELQDAKDERETIRKLIMQHMGHHANGPRGAQ